MNDYYNGYFYPNYNINPNMMRRSMPINYNVPNTNAFRAVPNMGGATRSPGLLSRLLGGSAASSPGITSGLAGTGGALKTFSWSGLLNSASKTLGVINQAIPVVTQIKPIWNNAKTMFRVMKAVNSDSKSSSTTDSTTKETTNNTNNETTAIKKETTTSNNNSNDGSPTFFV